MENNNDSKTVIADLHERRKFLALLMAEYKDRIKFDNLRDDELDRSTEELRALKTQIHLIDTALAEMEEKSGLPDAQ